MDACWQGNRPAIVTFQLHCTDLGAELDGLHAMLRAMAEVVVEQNLGRFNVLHYDEPAELPDMKVGPMVMTKDGPMVHANLEKRILQKGFYLLLATEGQGGDAIRRLQLMRSILCAACGRCAAFDRVFEGVLSEGEKLGAASNSLQMPQRGFRAILSSEGFGRKLTEAFLAAASQPKFEAALEVFNAALDQTNLSAKHLLYWSALEALGGGPGRLGNRLAAAYGTTTQALESLIPFRRLKEARDHVAHRGHHSALSQADERILQGIFVDLLVFDLHGAQIQTARLLHEALGD